MYMVKFKSTIIKSYEIFIIFLGWYNSRFYKHTGCARDDIILKDDFSKNAEHSLFFDKSINMNFVSVTVAFFYI